jgi:hypothetical protein
MAPNDQDTRERLIKLEVHKENLEKRVSAMETKLWAVIGVVLLAVGRAFLNTIGLGQ